LLVEIFENYLQNIPANQSIPLFCLATLNEELSCSCYNNKVDSEKPSKKTGY